MSDRVTELTAELSLEPHPEGGHYRRWYLSDSGERPALSVIDYLLPAREYSRWHQVDADELWHHVEGAPLTLYRLSADFAEAETVVLSDSADSGLPATVVPAGWWQAAQTNGAYTLVTCAVAPSFRFSGFRILADDPAAAAQLRLAAPDLAGLL